MCMQRTGGCSKQPLGALEYSTPGDVMSKDDSAMSRAGKPTVLFLYQFRQSPRDSRTLDCLSVSHVASVSVRRRPSSRKQATTERVRIAISGRNTLKLSGAGP